MEFQLKAYATLVGRTNDDGKKGCFPTYHVDIDGSRIADEYREHNLTPEQVADIVGKSEDEISHAISKIIASHVRPYIVNKTRVKVSRTKVKVPAEVETLNPCGGIDSEIFDCGLALDEFPLSELPSEYDEFPLGACNYGDEVYLAAIRLGLVRSWNKPFSFNIMDWRAYDLYIAARVRNEYGVELRG